MVTPLFSNLTPRYIDNNWYQLDKALDEDAILTALEKEHQNAINELVQKDCGTSSANQGGDQFEEEEEEDNNDDESVIESEDDDDEDMGDNNPWVK